MKEKKNQCHSNAALNQTRKSATADKLCTAPYHVCI